MRGLELNDAPDRDDRKNWNELRDIFTQKFLEKSQSEWEKVFDGTDACVTPVIPLTAEDNRPIANLSESSSLGVEGPKLEILEAGSGTKEVMKDWIGWTVGKDYVLDTKGTVNIASFARL